MKKSLLIILITLATVPIANCGIGGIPGSLTFDSVGPGKRSQPSQEATRPVRKQERATAATAGVAHGKRKARISADRTQRSGLEAL